MQPTNVDRAVRVAAKSEAYAWYCQENGIPMPFADGQFEPADELMERHAAAWAWAEENWSRFVSETDSDESQLLIEMLRKCEKAGEGQADPES
jgi:ferric-dicitrate binding protein FerR (iron transport regulator)